MRLVPMTLLAAAAAIATPAAAKTPLDGVWLFDQAPSYPGVTMVELSSDAGKPTGAVTTAWYGRMDMQNVTLDGNTLSFDLRNLNDKAHATRRWTARRVNGDVVLEGDIWSSHVVQTGRRGTAAQAAARTFKVASLPPLGALAPDGLAATPPMGWSRDARSCSVKRWCAKTCSSML